jgi:outer membrane protein TolC
LDNNKTLQLRQSEYRVAQDGLQEAASRLWPTLSFNSSASYLTDPQKGVAIKAGTLGSAPNANAKFPTPVPGTDIVLVPDPLHTYFKLGTTLSVPLFTWGKLSQAVHLAEVQVNLASLNTEKTTEETRRDVRKAYFGSVMPARRSGCSRKWKSSCWD